MTTLKRYSVEAWMWVYPFLMTVKFIRLPGPRRRQPVTSMLARRAQVPCMGQAYRPWSACFPRVHRLVDGQ